jgi:DNA-binding transcriptional MerR regulator
MCIFFLIITFIMSYYSVMKTSSEYFSIDDLCTLTGLTRRGIRFYVQKELLMPPIGLGRGAKYTRAHLEELLLILKWKNAGVSLEGIREILSEQRGDKPLPPNPRPKPGDVSVCSRIVITDGIELLIDPEHAGLSPEELRSLIKEILSLHSNIKSGSLSCTVKQSSE